MILTTQISILRCSLVCAVWSGTVCLAAPQENHQKSPATFLSVFADAPGRQVRLGTIDSSGADLLDVDDLAWFTTAPGQTLALIRRGSWKVRPSQTRVTLDDGQVFPGSLIRGDADEVLIYHPWMRELAIPLERIRRIDFKTNIIIPPGEDDRIVLTNGDVLEGFVTQVGRDAIIETHGETPERITVPLHRVAAVAISTQETPPHWPQVWMVDGLRMSLERAEFDASGRLSLARHPLMSGDYERLPGSDELVALVLDGARFEPLAHQHMRTVATTPVRRTAPPPERLNPRAPAGLTSLHLTGPARFEFDLPPRTTALRTRIVTGHLAQGWTPPEVVISVGNSILWRGWPDQDLDVPLSGAAGPLVIELHCGEHGPMHCGVTLVDPILIKVP
jgi:hypothetical protein